jgi:hypothetical protein
VVDRKRKATVQLVWRINERCSPGERNPLTTSKIGPPPRLLLAMRMEALDEVVNEEVNEEVRV